MLLTIIITILVYSAIVTLINVIGTNTRCDEDTMMILSYGPIGWLLVGIINLITYIDKKTKRFRYKSMLVCPDDKVRYCDFDYADEYCKLEGYSFVNAKRFKTEGWDNKNWKPSDRFYDIASTRYVPRKIWKNYEEI